VKKLLLASVLAIASFPGYAADQNSEDQLEICTERYLPDVKGELQDQAGFERCMKQGHAPARVTVAPLYSGPPPIGWVYGPYTQCANPPQCSMGVVSVQADGLNVRVAPNGASPAVMALVNGTLFYPVRREGPWLLVAAGCDLTPTFAWSWTAGVPLNRCWVYF
jgi:hypothetical protein